MIHKIIPVTDPKLREISRQIQKIDKKTASIISDLKETLLAQKDPEGVGLAAPQIGRNVRIFAMKPAKKIKIIINPEILEISNKEDIAKGVLEGCLSLPHYYGPLKRAKKITIKYLDEKGVSQTETFKGFPAHIVQHEIDHLEGKLFIDKVIKEGGKLYKINPDETWEEVELI
jgi:peptide deformylase